MVVKWAGFGIRLAWVWNLVPLGTSCTSFLLWTTTQPLLIPYSIHCWNNQFQAGFINLHSDANWQHLTLGPWHIPGTSTCPRTSLTVWWEKPVGTPRHWEMYNLQVSVGQQPMNRCFPFIAEVDGFKIHFLKLLRLSFQQVQRTDFPVVFNSVTSHILVLSFTPCHSTPGNHFLGDYLCLTAAFRTQPKKLAI